MIEEKSIHSLGGLINAVYAKTYDHVSFIPNFILTPLNYVGGVFYSISLGLPANIAALIVSLQPILTNIFAGPILKETDINRFLDDYGRV